MATEFVQADYGKSVRTAGECLIVCPVQAEEVDANKAITGLPGINESINVEVHPESEVAVSVTVTVPTVE